MMNAEMMNDELKTDCLFIHHSAFRIPHCFSEVTYVYDVSRVITLEELRSVPLFASLDDEAASELRNLLELREVPGGTTLFRLGDSGDSMYLIESGRVRISIRDADGSDVTLAELAGGDFFGEMALLDGKPRSADTTVIEDAFFAVLSRDNFLKFVRTNPDVALKMLSAITHRLRKTDEMLRHRVSRNVNEEEDARLTVGDRLANRIAELRRQLDVHSPARPLHGPLDARQFLAHRQQQD